MDYKIRVFHVNTNMEAFTIETIFKGEKAAETAILDLEALYPSQFEYVKVPVQSISAK
ncbi:hypothetical protein M1K46_13985 [Fictibacillus sp. WQ 8-8]|uniref:hypothetical protein n=1 Tax=unclassified Fictibacillus TaxID=2644029 RepID=UPI0008E383D1|nr:MULTISPECIES: hypothetical protein [unclassified Fictibacillus]MCQ6266763.1 hypothetical protein [Fictibacillus sp. WQ 8-8]SFD53301.1 hypothetical protein SAMN05428981_101796 [Bacillus sp. OV194]